MKKLVVLSGAGMSAESGVRTFRDNDGLWQKHRVEEVASPIAWARDPGLVLTFYNERRKQLFEVEPNAGHRALIRLEEKYEVQIVTQNVDDLHERAGSSRVLHLHGELKKARSTLDPRLIYTLDHWELKLGDTCEKGSQLRPHIVWFGEPVDQIVPAAGIVAEADLLIVVGTSMVVYPAAGLVTQARPEIDKYYVDPNAFAMPGIENLEIIAEKAGTGLPRLVDRLLA